MNLQTALILLSVITFATYFQTVTGFGIGIIVVGISSAFNLAPITQVAAITSLVILVNSAVALPGKLRYLDWTIARYVLLGVFPAAGVGVWLLEYTSTEASRLLLLMLGITIICSGAVSMYRPARLTKQSSNLSFFISGLLSGLFGGMFGMSGAPVIFHFYRQPFDLSKIRHMLLLTIAFAAGARSVFAGMQGALTPDTWILLAFTLPLAALATLTGQRYPPPLSPLAMRRVAFGSLILIGGWLVLKACRS